MKYAYLFLLFLITVQLKAQSTIESVPNEKLINGSYVSNPDKILDERTTTQIDTLLSSLENKTSVQVAVVAVESIGDQDVFAFAQQLFDKWGIGNRDNGLLILLVKDIHTIRFHTGYGVEGLLPDVVCKRIQRDHMLPSFRKDDYNSGMLTGIQEVSRMLTNPSAVEELSSTEEEISNWGGFVIFLATFVLPIITIIYFVKRKTFTDSKKQSETPYPEMRMSRWTWLLIFLGMPILIIVAYSVAGREDQSGECFLTLYLYFMATLIYRWRREKKVINRLISIENYSGVVDFLRKQQWYWFFMGLFFPLPFLLYFVYHLSRKKIYRNHPRKCKQCQGKMRKLSDKAEDEFLSAEQKAEEVLKSVDYDVWQCESCQSIDMWFFLNSNTKYTPCPKCKTIAYHLSENITIESATYSTSGKGEEIHSCEYCSYQKKKSYTIPKLVRSTSTSGSGSSFGGSSSSSSGGSWGGGRSGGGGASSSW